MSTAYLFPGQGSQYVGMGADWYRASAAARALYERADEQLGYALSTLCFDGPSEQLDRTEYTQPAIFITSLAMWEAAKGTLGRPDYVAGHSLGEFAALVVAGVWEFPAALELVAERGRLMARAGERTPGGMAVLLGADVETAARLCQVASDASGAPLVVANDNCPGQVVIAGATAALDVAMEKARSLGVRRIRRLPVSVAPHSPLMATSQADFLRLLEQAPLQEPHLPVVMNATAAPLNDVAEIRAALLRQLTSPVRWRESLLWLAEQGVDVYVEVGPKSVLAGMVKRTVEDARVETLESLVEEL